MLAVGLAVSVLQALTQVQEPTLAFLPKLVAMALVLLLSGPRSGAPCGLRRRPAGRIVSAGGMP
jgi:flagellar biosynthetic protein FliQ